MSDQTDILTRTLGKLGLESAESEIYLHLLEKGSKSALEISRSLHIARTRVYRLLDKLQAKGLVTQKFDTLGLKFTASSHKQLELLIAERQSELDGVKASLPSILAQLDGLSANDSASKVLYHHGIEGLKHVTWNSLRAEKELRIYEVSDSMTAFLSQDFSEKVREQLIEHKIHTLQLTNATSIHEYTKHTTLVTDLWTPKYISKKEIAIQSEILIYNDVTAMYHYQQNDIFCVEIINQDLANMQRQLFDFIWSRATPMKKLSDFGKASI